MIDKIPLFYFEPTICCIDDNALFLQSAKQFLSEYNTLTFTDPTEAYNFLSVYQSPLSNINFSQALIDSDSFDISNTLPININIENIYNLADISLIKNEIAIVIIDNNMPYLNGLDICKKFKKYDFKKILLTGETTTEEAVDAFNMGLIDKFITKNCLIKTLKESIHELILQFFCDKTKSLSDYVEVSHLSPLSDPVFIRFFYKWVSNNKIKEFYLINKHGSFLLKDFNGESTCFVVMSEHIKNQFIELNDDSFNETSELFIPFSKGEIIPFFGIGKDSWDYSTEDWKNHFYEANIIHGREKYYWSSIPIK